MGRKIRFLIAAAMASVSICATASADIVVDHQPHPYGGGASDTEFMYGPTLVWQRLADDFSLSENAVVRHFAWWGFYDRNNPPTSETMRVRIYRPREGDGLPDESNMLFEEYYVNPLREYTGRFIFTGISPKEYRFDVDLMTPVYLPSDDLYWIEIAEIGDPLVHFRWEDSQYEHNGQTFTNSIVLDWQHTGNYTDLAFQISTVPEPSALAFLLLTACVLPMMKASRKGGVMR